MSETTEKWNEMSESIDKKLESEFFSKVLDLCLQYGVELDCSDPYEYLVLKPLLDKCVFETEFRRLYIDQLWLY